MLTAPQVSAEHGADSRRLQRPTIPVVVAPDDTLWGIARHELGHSATRGDIDRRWHQWYHANHQVIGPDPDLILPGQTLYRPTREAS